MTIGHTCHRSDEYGRDERGAEAVGWSAVPDGATTEPRAAVLNVGTVPFRARRPRKSTAKGRLWMIEVRK